MTKWQQKPAKSKGFDYPPKHFKKKFFFLKKFSQNFARAKNLCVKDSVNLFSVKNIFDKMAATTFFPYFYTENWHVL
jgi:hypothetical protein